MAPLRLKLAVFFHLSSADSPSTLTASASQAPRNTTSYDPAQGMPSKHPSACLLESGCGRMPRELGKWGGAGNSAALARRQGGAEPGGLLRVEVVGVTCLLTAPLPACPRPRPPQPCFPPSPGLRGSSPPQLQHLGPGRPCGQPCRWRLSGLGHVCSWLASSLDPGSISPDRRAAWCRPAVVSAGSALILGGRVRGESPGGREAGNSPAPVPGRFSEPASSPPESALDLCSFKREAKAVGPSNLPSVVF